MDKDDNLLCHVPVRARFVFQDGQMIEESYEYADIPAKVLADFILEKFGINPEGGV